MQYSWERLEIADHDNYYSTGKQTVTTVPLYCSSEQIGRETDKPCTCAKYVDAAATEYTFTIHAVFFCKTINVKFTNVNPFHRPLILFTRGDTACYIL